MMQLKFCQWNFLYPCIISLRSNKNVPMWIIDIFRMVGFVLSSRIMSRSMHPCGAIKIVVNVGREKARSKGQIVSRYNLRRRWSILTRVSHVFHELTAHTPFLPINQASRSRMTHQPIGYVAPDKDLSAALFPE